MNKAFWQSKKVLVTGGAGFIGSYLVEQLVSLGSRVRVVDNLIKGRMENLKAVNKEIEFIKDDLRERSVCKKVTLNMDVVINLAAIAYGLEYSYNHHGEMLTTNSQIALNVLEAAQKNSVERYLVVSSSCVYSDDVVVPTPEVDLMFGNPEKANEGYGWAKRIAELQAMYYARECEMKIAIVRPFNAYGGRYIWEEKCAHVIPSLVKKVMDGNDPVVVWGSGNQRRDFLHGTDFARGMILVTEKYAVGDPVNLGLDNDISIRELLSIICDVTDKHPKIVFDTSKPEGRFRKSSDPTKMHRVVGGFKPQVSLREGIQEMTEWYKNNFSNTTSAEK
jgi:nucleoside-diphosphate-sugar epimerase